jgi:hypothetical protein
MGQFLEQVGNDRDNVPKPIVSINKVMRMRTMAGLRGCDIKAVFWKRGLNLRY